MFDRKSLEAAEPRYVHRTAVRFQDVDAAGVVFFARIFDYLHDAWLAFMEDAGRPLAAVIAARQWGIPLRRAEADFLAPLRFGDKLEVGLVGIEWKGSNISVGYNIRIVSGRVAAVGLTHHVVVDVATMTRIDPPPDLVAMLRPLEQQ